MLPIRQLSFWVRCNMTQRRTNSAYPHPLTPIFGREREIAQLADLLLHSDRQFITLRGPGGVGKTHLALHLAPLLEDSFPGGVHFIALDACTEHISAINMIGHQLDRDWDAVPDIEHLAQVINVRRTLLILDNLEQISGIGKALSTLMQHTTQLSILGTSQKQAGIAGEIVVLLEPLPLPASTLTESSQLLDNPCVQIFLDQAHRVTSGQITHDTDLLAIAEITRTLDGMPLAIQLAAAKVNVLPPAALVDRLRHQLEVLSSQRSDVPPRLRTIRGAIEWSFNRLNPVQQLVFLHLCLFEGAIDLELVEELCQQLLEHPGGLDVVESLVANSMVRHMPESNQFLILSGLRTYGKEYLQHSPHAPFAHKVLTDVLAAMVARADIELTERHQPDVLNRLDRAYPTIRALMTQAVQQGDNEVVARIGGHLWRYAEIRGGTVELAGWLDNVLTDSATGVDIANAWIARGYVGAVQQSWDLAVTSFESAVKLLIDSPHKRELAQAYCGLARAWRGKGEINESRSWLDRAEFLARQVGFKRAEVTVMVNRAELCVLEHRLDAAQSLFEHSINDLEDLGDVVCMAATIARACEIELQRNDLQRALELLLKVEAIDRAYDSRSSLTLTLISLARVRSGLGDHASALSHLDEAIEICRTSGLPRIEQQARLLYAQIAHASDNDPLAAKACAELLNLYRNSVNRETVTAVLDILGDIVTIPTDMATIAAVVAMPQCSPEILLQVHKIAERAAAAPPRVVGDSILSARETEILQLLALDLSTAEIAETLSISPRTVTTHIANAMTKLNVKSRTAAVTRALDTPLRRYT